jgi:patatin-like phospholipase/acyl hydrolase
VNTEKKFTILSFVGGGIRGLMSTTILQRLYDYNQSIVLNTDLIAGCSTGSIITSELLAGKLPGDIIDLFTGSEIGFYNKLNPDPKAPGYPIDEVYASQLALHGEQTVNDAGRNVLFVSFNVGGLEERDGIMVPKPWAPVMYTNMLGEGQGDTTIAKAATSSGAMPGQLGSFQGNVDGAFFNHDPTIAAIALAVKNGHKLENIVAITIGTGLMFDWIATDTHDWGAQQWMDGVANPFDNTPPFLMNQATPSPMLDMCLNGTSTDLMPQLASMLLGERYVNINPHLPCFIPENSTSPQAIELLRRHGATADIAQAKRLLDDYWIGLPGAAATRA